MKSSNDWSLSQVYHCTLLVLYVDVLSVVRRCVLLYLNVLVVPCSSVPFTSYVPCTVDDVEGDIYDNLF